MPDVIGGATYSLELDTGKFYVGSRQAQGEFDRLKQKGDAVSASSGGLSNALGGVGRTAVAVAAGMGGLNLAVTLSKESITGTVLAAAAAAASEARLQTAVTASGASYADYAKQLDAVIKKGEQLGFSREETQSGLSILIAQTGSVTEATKRYAIAQDLARGANIDIVTSSRLLGKITDENVSALQRYGIAIKKGSTETEALAAVQQKFNGQAQAFGDSPAGQFERTKIAIHDAGVELGTVLLPGVLAASQGLASGAHDAELFAGKLEGAGHVGADVFPSLITGAVAFGAALAAIKIASLVSDLAALQSGATGLRALQTEFTGLEGAGLVSTGVGAQARLGLDALGASLLTPTGGLIAFTGAVVAADVASRKLTGSGLIEWLDGSASASRRAADAAKAVGDAEKDLANLSKLGVSGPSAGALELAKISAGLGEVNAKWTQYKKNVGEPLFGSLSMPKAWSSEVTKLGDNLQTAFDKGVITYEQFRAAANNPLFGDRFKQDIKDTDALILKIRGSVGAAADTLRSARSEFDKGLKLATSEITDKPNPVVEGLKLHLLTLEQLKRTAEETYGVASDQAKAYDAQIASLNSTIADQESSAKIAEQAINAWGAAALAAAGNDTAAINAAKDATTRLGDTITSLPREATIKLSLLDPEHIQELLDALAAGLSFDVAIRLVTGTPAQQEETQAATWAGSAPGSQQARAVEGIAADQVKGDLDKWQAAIQHNIDIASGNAPNFDRGAGGPDPKEKADTKADDLEALAAAYAAFHAATGGTIEDFRAVLKWLSDAGAQTQKLSDTLVNYKAAVIEANDAAFTSQAVYLKLAEDRLALEQKATQTFVDYRAAVIEANDATYQSQLVFQKYAEDRLTLEQRLSQAAVDLRVRQIEQSDTAYQLQATYAAIAEEALRSGKSVQEVTADMFRGILANAQSALDGILNAPTRESTAMQLQIDLLQRQRDLLVRGGADTTHAGKPGETAADKQLAAIDAQIKALQEEQNIRKDDLAIMKDQAALANKGLQTDRDVLNADVFLKGVIANLSGTVTDLDKKMGLLVFSAAAAAGALGSMGGFSDQQKAYVDAVARLKGETPPYPGFALGTPYVPETGPALLHKGERVITAADNARLSTMAGTAAVVAQLLDRRESLQVLKSTEIRDVLQGSMGMASSIAIAQKFGLPQYERGTDNVPQTGLALVHENERIVSAGENRSLTQLLQSPLAGAPKLRLNAGLEGLNLVAPRFTSPEPASGAGAGVVIEKGAFQQNFTIHADMSDETIEKVVRKVEQANERSIRTAQSRGSLRPIGTFSGR